MRLITNCEKKKYLERYAEINDTISRKLLECDRLRAVAEKCTVTLTDMPRGGGNDRADDYVRLVEMDIQTRAVCEKRTAIKQEVEAAICTVQNLALRRLLWDRYINGWGWARIAKRIGRTVHVTRLKLHARALDAVQIEE